jgi:uncharacterized protein YjbJ (UPF0337 family)
LSFETERKAELYHSHLSRSEVLEEEIMDKDRVEGSAKEIKGKTKEIAGKVLGDAKLKSDGKADRAAGKIQNAVGGVKDTLKVK